MVINSLESQKISAAEKERLIYILDLKTTDDEILREAVHLLHKSGSVNYA